MTREFRLNFYAAIGALIGAGRTSPGRSRRNPPDRAPPVLAVCVSLLFSFCPTVRVKSRVSPLLRLLESLGQLLRTATQIKDRVDNNPIGFDHIEDSEGISRDQQPAIPASVEAPAQGESRKLFEPGLYVVKEGLFFPVSMFSNPIVGVLQVLFRSQEEDNLHYLCDERIPALTFSQVTTFSGLR